MRGPVCLFQQALRVIMSPDSLHEICDAAIMIAIIVMAMWPERADKE